MPWIFTLAMICMAVIMVILVDQIRRDRNANLRHQYFECIDIHPQSHRKRLVMDSLRGVFRVEISLPNVGMTKVFELAILALGELDIVKAAIALNKKYPDNTACIWCADDGTWCAKTPSLTIDSNDHRFLGSGSDPMGAVLDLIHKDNPNEAHQKKRLHILH